MQNEHEKAVELNPLASVSAIGEDLQQLANSLGYHWPSDDEGRWRCLKSMAQTASHWRAEVEKCQSEMWPQIEATRIMQHKTALIRSLSRKLKNTRTALRDYMASQAAFVREGLAEIRSR